MTFAERRFIFMKFDESISKELSIRSEYDSDFSEKSTKLMIDLNKALLSGDPEEVYKLANSFNQIKDLQIIIEEELDVFKLYIGYSMASYVGTAIKNGLPKDIGESIKKKYYIKIAHSRNKRELYQLSFYMVEELMLALKQYSFKQYSLVIKMALEHIHNNKFTFLYAKDVANAIHVNRSYLSKRFSEEVGETITDYIHKTKMDFSIELMESNVYHFNEIAEVLGYRNYSYYSRVFKKYYHMSPVAYMKKQG